MAQFSPGGVFASVLLATASALSAAPHYVSLGHGEPALVFVHGWTCDSSFWQAQLDEFSKHRHVIAIDLPGHGQTPAPSSGFQPRTFVEAVDEVIRGAKLKRVVLVGHSMGGAVIRQYARLHPERVAGLVFIDAPFEFKDTPERRAMADNFGGAEGPANRKKFIEPMFLSTTAPALREQILTSMLKTPEMVAVGAFEWLVDELTSPQKPLEWPALVLIRQGGRKPPAELAPGATVVEVQGAGHFVMSEKPQETNRLIADFIAKLR